MTSVFQKSRKVRGEELEQARLVRWTHRPDVRLLMPMLAFLHHSPNGGVRDAVTGGQMKALGAKAGFPDLILPAATAQHPGLVIEMKSAIGRTSPAQDQWLDHFKGQGWAVWLARSASEGREIVCQYLGIDPGQAPAMDA